MNTTPATTGAEEGAISVPLEKLPKLNLPPKPVLATTATTRPPTPTPAPAATPTTAAAVTKPTTEPPPIAPTPVPPPTSTQVATQPKKIEAAETPTANQKRMTLSMPLAIVAFAIALLGLIVQLFCFLHLF